MNKTMKTFTNGIIKENPVLVTLLGMCPALAVTTTFFNGFGMGIATTFVLICSNVTVSLLKNIIPAQVRLPCYIIVIAGFVTFVEKILAAYMPLLYDSLGLFLPLIAVNCIVFGRAELFASKNNPGLSALDGLGMGIGFTLALVLMGCVRELLGFGTILAETDFVIHLPILSENPMVLFILPAGGFFTFAVIIAVMNKLKKQPPHVKNCENCPSRRICKLSEK
jgi:electron transport complex protein RnfE